jgi:ubiquitin-conjugating enzyme E2 variant
MGLTRGEVAAGCFLLDPRCVQTARFRSTGEARRVAFERPLQPGSFARVEGPEPLGRRRRTWQSSVDLLLVLLAVALVLWLGADVWSATFAAGAWWLLPLGLVVGLLSADFTSGAVHWLLDRCFTEDTPVIGPILVRPFREHHVEPQRMVGHGMLELHGNTCLPVIATLACARALPADTSQTGWLLFEAWLFCFAATGMWTNQFHEWAHADTCSRPVRWLQRARLILSPEDHARHHSEGFRTHYCMTTGWLNPVLDRIDFFARLERGLRALRITTLSRTAPPGGPPGSAG